MPSHLTIVQVPTDDAATLLKLSRVTFFDAFAHLNNAADMEAFAAKAFTMASFEEQLGNPDSHFFYALVNGETAGYIKINYNNAQTEFNDPNALEVERIYVLQTYQGQQIGQQLIDFATQKALDKQFKYIWLGVWEHNEGAIRFYHSRGFTIVGRHPFMLGNDLQTDLLMRKDL